MFSSNSSEGTSVFHVTIKNVSSLRKKKKRILSSYESGFEGRATIAFFSRYNFHAYVGCSVWNIAFGEGLWTWTLISKFINIFRRFISNTERRWQEPWGPDIFRPNFFYRHRFQTNSFLLCLLVCTCTFCPRFSLCIRNQLVSIYYCRRTFTTVWQ